MSTGVTSDQLVPVDVIGISTRIGFQLRESVHQIFVRSIGHSASLRGIIEEQTQQVFAEL